MSDNRRKDELMYGIPGSILDEIRQLRFPAEFRIAAPASRLHGMRIVEPDLQCPSAAEPPEQQADRQNSRTVDLLVKELGTCLWYLKTKHFKRDWNDAETGDDDPSVRRALGRVNKSIEALDKAGIEIHDPTNQRYPQGGEGMMRPVQFLPTPGLTFELVSETVAPIIYREDRLIQRGEVFVAVPKQDEDSAETATETAIRDASDETSGPCEERETTDEKTQTSEGDREADSRAISGSNTRESEPELPATASKASDGSDDGSEDDSAQLRDSPGHISDREEVPVQESDTAKSTDENC